MLDIKLFFKDILKLKQGVTGYAILVFGLLASIVTIWSIGETYSSVFYGDYEQIFHRAVLLKNSNISLLDFLFLRQVDHPHFLVFFLAYIDIFNFGGRAFLLYGTSLLFLVAVTAAICYSFCCSTNNNSDRCIFIGVVLLMLFGGQNIGVLFQPFQVTLVGTMSLVAVGLYQVITRPGLFFQILGSVLLSVAIISHGSGVAVIPILFGLYLIERRKSFLLIFVWLSAEFVLYSHFYPATGNISIDKFFSVFNSLAIWGEFLKYFIYLVGHSIIFGLFTTAGDVFVGFLGVLYFFYFVFRYIRGEVRNTFLIALAMFGFVVSGLSVLLNIIYSETRSVSLSFEYFFQDRYLPAAYMFWIGVFGSYLLLPSNYKPKKIKPLLVGIAIASVVSLNFAAVASIKSNFILHEKRLVVEENIGCLKRVDVCTLASAVGLPVYSAYKWSEDVFKLQHELNAVRSVELNSCSGRKYFPEGKKNNETHVRRIAAANFSDVNWDKGISRNTAGFFVTDPALLKGLSVCSTIRFSKNDDRKVVLIEKNNIYLSGSPLNSEENGYPAAFSLMLTE